MVIQPQARLDALSKKHYWNPLEFAQIMGMSVASLHAWERTYGVIGINSRPYARRYDMKSLEQAIMIHQTIYRPSIKEVLDFSFGIKK